MKISSQCAKLESGILTIVVTRRSISSTFVIPLQKIQYHLTYPIGEVWDVT